MKGTEELRRALVELLNQKGIPALEEFGGQKMVRHREPVLALSIRAWESAPSGFGDYLGDRYDPVSRTWQELRGRKLELSIGLAAFAPGQFREGGDCQTLLERGLNCLERTLPAELRLRQTESGELSYDRETDCYVCRGGLRCGAFYLATEAEEPPLLDFILKGVIEHGDNQP